MARITVLGGGIGGLTPAIGSADAAADQDFTGGVTDVVGEGPDRRVAHGWCAGPGRRQ